MRRSECFLCVTSFMNTVRTFLANLFSYRFAVVRSRHDLMPEWKMPRTPILRTRNIFSLILFVKPSIRGIYHWQIWLWRCKITNSSLIYYWEEWSHEAWDSLICIMTSEGGGGLRFDMSMRHYSKSRCSSISQVTSNNVLFLEYRIYCKF